MTQPPDSDPTQARTGPPDAPQETDPGAGAALLDELLAAMHRYVILPSTEATWAVALWIVATHAQPFWGHAPRLVIRAPEKRCGKSRLLDLVEATCHAPLITVNASPAAVYRSIGTGDPPTILLDEADTIFGGKAGESNEDLRGLLNAGHQRNRPALRYDASRQCVEQIPTFAMAALAGIGAMPDTIEDRAVVVRMRRRAPGETVAPFREKRDRAPLRLLAERIHEWARGNADALLAAEPAMPVEDRAADTWEPLIAVADLAGDEWPDRARLAAVILTNERESNSTPGNGVRLLADCRTAFGDEPALHTTQLLGQVQGRPGSTVDRLWAQRADRDEARQAPRRIRHPLWERPAPRHWASEGLLSGRFRRRLGPVLPHRPGRPRRRRWDGVAGGAVPAVPASSSQVSPGTA